MKLCDGIGIYMMVYGCVCAHMGVCESIWWYMNVNGGKWDFMKNNEVLRCYMNAYESIWMYMSQYDGMWKNRIA